MASIYQRRHTWWVQFYHPRSGRLTRGSLETHDKARAELLRQKIEIEVHRLTPRLQAVEIPAPVRELLGEPETIGVLAARPLDSAGNFPAAQPPPASSAPTRAARAAIDEALKAYIAFIHIDNAPRHVENKLSMLRRFLGSERAEQFVAVDNPKLRERRLKEPTKAFFAGHFLDEITPLTLQEFFQQLSLSTKTKRHYREFFHHFFSFCLKSGLYRPENWHCPNPTSALPSYLSKNRRIIFLKPEEVEVQLETLRPYPAFHMAAALMIYAGLRRAETLWLMRDSIAPDLSFLSVLNRMDEDNDIESSLKTGERSVTILPPLRRVLEEYLPTLRGQWLVPSPKGTRWNDDAFAKRLRVHNQQANLKWSSLHYRHSYATQRAAQGWSLLRIASEMGNSVAIVAEYYAAYMRPVEIGVPGTPVELRVVGAA
ncbi:MAG: tyrosine-type recombinase/integrase [Chthoniobacter sp.]|nr:tyrosine-type recombinase/integrase [Chthoniobacter sp.]